MDTLYKKNRFYKYFDGPHSAAMDQPSKAQSSSPDPARQSRDHPLDGLRVVDFSSGIAGGYCTKLLADAGADVVKLEGPSGDPLRRWSLAGAMTETSPIPPSEDGALFQYLHTSKRGLVYDLAEADDRAKAFDLAAEADLVVESFGPRTRAQFGLDLESLTRRRAGCSLVSISHFGSEGPWADRPATEFTLQAWSGSMNGRGDFEGAPLVSGGRTGEWITGAFAAMSALAAWQRTRRTGRGEHIDVSMLESILFSHTVFQPLGDSMDDPIAQLPFRSIEVPSIEPARDGYAGFAPLLGQQWHDFCRLVGHPEWIEEEDLVKYTVRASRIDEIREAIGHWLEDKTVAEAVELANLLRIPAVPVGNGASVKQVDHFLERGVFVKNPRGGFLQPRPPALFSEARHAPFRPAPLIGEHQAQADRPDPVFSKRSADFLDHDEAAAAADLVQSDLPLSGIRVTDFTAAWAGSFAAQILAMLGADVIKIESHKRPDSARFSTLKPIGDPHWWEWSSLYQGSNAGKRGITLDLARAEGLDLAKRLIQRSDIVLENFSPRVMEHFGLDWEGIRAINPRAIYARMPAFGLTGPWRDNVGFAQSSEQASGMSWITGHPDQAPINPRGPCDPQSGLHAAFAILAALEHRRHSGVGTLIESTMIEPALNIAAEAIVEHGAYGYLAERMGNRSPVAAPQGCYESADSDHWIALSVENDAQWQGLCRAIEHADWAADAALESAAGRRAAHDALDRDLAAWCATRSVDAAVARLLEAGVPAAPVVPQWQSHENEQLEARRYHEALDHPVVGRHSTYPGLPFQLSEGPDRWLRRPAPCLGEHNDDVLIGLLGLSPEEVAKLRESGVIADAPVF